MVPQKTMKMTRLYIIFAPVLVFLITFPSYHNVAAESFLMHMCKQVFPELRNCSLSCSEGLLMRDGCPRCACRSSICVGKCYYGQRCTIVQKQGQYGNQISDVAICEPEEVTTAVPHSTTLELLTTQEYLGSCDFQGRCNAAGRCPNSDSVCRKDGMCCRVKPKVDYNIGDRGAGMSRCMDTPSLGHCRGLGLQYIYNKETGKCQSMIYGGCTDSANSFQTLEHCQKTCEHPCQKPKTLGRCRASIPRFYFNEETESCEPFDLGGCAGVVNYFMTPWGCETHCKGLKKKIDPEIIDRGQGRTTISTITTRKTQAPRTNNPNPDYGNNDGGDQNDRDSLTNQILSKFRNHHYQENRNKPDNNNEDGQIHFRPRPTPNRRTYRVDKFGNVVYSRKTAAPTDVTKTPTSTIRAVVVPETSGDKLGRLADRYRSAQKVVNSFHNGQVNYNRASGGAPVRPTYSDYRSFRRFAPQYSYQSSVDNLRSYMKEG